MVLILLILVLYLKKPDYNTKNGEIENKITDHDHISKYIIIQ